MVVKAKSTQWTRHPAIIDELIDSQFFKLNVRGRKGTKAFRINARRFAAVKLMQEDYTIYEIASLLECNQDTIFRDLKVMHNAMIKVRYADMETRRISMIEKIGHLANYNWRRLQAIKNPASGGKFAEEIRKCYMEISALMGLYPDKTVHLTHSSVEKMTKEHKDAVIEAAFQTVNSDIKLIEPVKVHEAGSSAANE